MGKGKGFMPQGMNLNMPSGAAVNKVKIELIKIVLSVTKQLLGLPEEKRQQLISDMELAVQTGDLSKLPEDIKIV